MDDDFRKLIETLYAWLIIVGLFACCVIVYKTLQIYSGEAQLPMSAEHMIDYLKRQL
jgi:hypothetical protein